MPASVDPPIRVPHALLGRTSQRLAPMHAATVKLANFLRRQLQSAVRLAHHTRTHHPEALAVNVMQAMQSPGKGKVLGTPMAVAAGGFSEVCERGGGLHATVGRLRAMMKKLLTHAHIHR
jgi:hypothetical protein